MANKVATRLAGSINLSKLHHVILKKQGKTGIIEGVFIPIDKNFLERSNWEDKDGKTQKDILIPITVCMYEERDEKSKQDGFITKALPSEIYKAEKDKEGFEAFRNENQPFIGNVKDFSKGSATPSNNDAGGGQAYEEDDDLPF